MTVEEKAEKYAMDFVKSKYSNIYSVDAKFAFNAVKHDWLAGHTEAMRWRDPKEELPETGKPVLVKYRTAKNVEKHGIGKYFNLGIGNPWTIEGSTSRNVIGWRPIE